MPSTINRYDEWELPKARASIGFEEKEEYQHSSYNYLDTEFFDVKFYPYQAETEDPIFAAISKKHVMVYRLSAAESPPYQLLRVMSDADDTIMNCSCTWSKDPVTELPYLCVSGSIPTIKVYDVYNGRLYKVLAGHGNEINDLVTCPTDPLLIASASADTTARIWSLNPADDKQPCVCILGGEGHSSTLLTLAWHNTGRYMLSAGHDNCVCLWVLPDLSKRRKDVNLPQPIVVHFPHFYSSEIHSNIVDCVGFFGDMILSRACHENVIVLWRIEGFSSRDPIPSMSDAPAASEPEDRLTRSAFTSANSSTSPSQYSRLVQFSTPGCGHQFYLRFNLYYDPQKHPILAFGNAQSTIFFWDLARLMDYTTFIADVNDPDRNSAVPRPDWLTTVHTGKQRGPDAIAKLKESEERSSAPSSRTGSIDIEVDTCLSEYFNRPTLETWSQKYDLTRVEDPVGSHAHFIVPTKEFIGRQVAWSQSGEWCIVVGSKSLAIIMSRWHQDKDGSIASKKSSTPPVPPSSS